ncbi:hypothetical protein FACS189460_0980 [Deltaproteobacteria bacterium]|nr:hypothetical protein FACS189460_0980 [Deltaproteobacteria bacterium]
MDNKPLRLLRLPEVLDRIPVSKSTWWAGVTSGRYPQPVKLGPRVTTWLEEDINRMILVSRQPAAERSVKADQDIVP